MPYISRDSNGYIIKISDNATNDEQEFLTEDNKEIIEYLSKIAKSELRDSEQFINKLVRTDNAMARIIEDLVNVLIAKNIINFTDLPLLAQRKLISRQNMRSNLAAFSNLVSDKNNII